MVDAAERLREFRSAVQSGAESEAIDLGGAAADALTRLSDRETGFDAAARIVLSEPSANDASQAAARSVVNALQNSRNRRAEFGVLLKGLAAGNFDQSTAVSVTDDVLDSLSAVEDAVSQFRATGAADELDPILVSIAPPDVTVQKGDDDPRPPSGTGDDNGGDSGNGNGNRGSGNGEDSDTTATVEFSVENVAGTAATELEVTFETDLPSATLTPSSVSRVESDASQSFTVEFDTDVSSGRYRLQTTVKSAEGGAESVVVPVFVLNKADYVEEVIGQLEGFERNIDDLESKASTRPIQRTVDEALRDLEQLLNELRAEDVDSKTANQTLFRVKQRLGRIEGLLSSLRGLSESKRAALLEQLSEITELIAEARGSEI